MYAGRRSRRPLPAPLAAVALLGPPGAGKSTLVVALAAATPLALFKLSAEAACAGVGPDPNDGLGWLSEEAAQALLHRRLPELTVAAAAGALIVFENFPGSGPQAATLADAVAAQTLTGIVAELQLPARALTERVGRRLVCASCGRAVDRRCRCGGIPTRRPEDEVAVFRSRLNRYLARRDQTLAALRARGWRLVALDARDEAACLADAVIAHARSAAGARH